MRHAHAGQAFSLSQVKETFHFTVEPVPHLFQHNIRIGILTGMLADGCDTGKNFIHIGHVEVAAKGKILRPPVISSEKRMNIGYPGFSGSRVTQMPHISFSGKRQRPFGKRGIVQLFFAQILEVALYCLKYLGDGTGTQCPLTEHILLTRIYFQFHTRQTGTFLTTVMLLFHQQIELIQPVHPRSVLLFIVLQRFKQTYHGNATFMFQLFHLFSI